MVNLQFVRARYNNDGSLTVWTVGEDNNIYPLSVVGFSPYFYVPNDEPPIDDEHILSFEEGFTHKDGFPVKKVIVTDPACVSTLRDEFSVHYEATEKFIRRWLIDTKLYSGLLLLANSYLRKQQVADLLPSAYFHPVNAELLDIEVLSKTRFPDPHLASQPLISFTSYNTLNRTYFTVILDDSNYIENPSPTWTVIHASSEKLLLQLLDKYFTESHAFIIAGWNINFDIDFSHFRALKFGIKLPLERFDRIDLCLAYKQNFKRLYNRLKDVAVDEEIFTPSQLVSDEYHAELWENREKRNSFLQYNKMDVEIMVKLDFDGWDVVDEETGSITHEPPKGLTDFYWNLRNFVGLESMEATMWHGVIVDTLMLREAFGNYVLNSSGHEEAEKYAGAVVFEPPEGVYDNIAVLDMSRYYPNIILGYNIDELACKVVHNLMNKRNEIEKEMVKYHITSPEYEVLSAKRDTVKFVLNTCYGYLGSPKSRLYKKDKAAKICEKARLGLNVIREASNKYGANVLYGDTDSILVQLESHKVPKLVDYLNNEVLVQLCKDEGIPSLLKLKFEKYASKVLFVEAKKKDVAAKKRYSMRVTWNDGKECDYIHVVGFDYVRGNASKITRKVQIKCLDEILRGNNSAKSLTDYLNKTVENIRDGKYSLSDIAIPITLGQPLNQYKVITDYVRAALWSNKNLGMEIVGGDRIKYLPVKKVEGRFPQTDVVAFFDEEKLPKIIPDYDKIIDSTITKKVDQFLRLVGVNWRSVEGSRDLREELY